MTFISGDSNQKQPDLLKQRVEQVFQTQVDECSELLEDVLRDLQSTCATQWNLILDEETLYEVVAHYLNILKDTLTQHFALQQSTTTESQLQKQGLDLAAYYQLILNPIKNLQQKLTFGCNNNKFGNLTNINWSRTDEMIGNNEDDDDNGGDQRRLVCYKLSHSHYHQQSIVERGGGGDSTFCFGNRTLSSWQFWFWRSDQRYPKWENGLQKLGKRFQTETQLESLVAQLLSIHEVVIPSDYMMFRAHIKPKWEDVANKQGGSWIIEFERNTMEATMVQTLWMRLLRFALITDHNDDAASGGGGGGDEHADDRHPAQLMIDSTTVRYVHSQICGLKISMRFKSYQISVWTANYTDLESIVQLGIAIRQRIIGLMPKLSSHLQLYYRAHKVSLQNALIKEQTKFGHDYRLFI